MDVSKLRGVSLTDLDSVHPVVVIRSSLRSGFSFLYDIIMHVPYGSCLLPSCMLGYWFCNMSMIDVQLVSCQTYVECILHFSDLLSGAFAAFDGSNYISNVTGQNSVCMNEELFVCYVSHFRNLISA